jgi:hypothetical protein
VDPPYLKHGGQDAIDRQRDLIQKDLYYQEDLFLATWLHHLPTKDREELTAALKQCAANGVPFFLQHLEW